MSVDQKWSGYRAYKQSDFLTNFARDDLFIHLSSQVSHSLMNEFYDAISREYTLFLDIKLHFNEGNSKAALLGFSILADRTGYQRPTETEYQATQKLNLLMTSRSAHNTLKDIRFLETWFAHEKQENFDHFPFYEENGNFNRICMEVPHIATYVRLASYYEDRMTSVSPEKVERLKFKIKALLENNNIETTLEPQNISPDNATLLQTSLWAEIDELVETTTGHSRTAAATTFYDDRPKIAALN